MPQTAPEDLIQTAINWAQQFTDLGVPDNLVVADGRLTPHTLRRSAMESTGPLTWNETEWTVTFRGVWQVDLDTMGVPKGPPHRIR